MFDSEVFVSIDINRVYSLCELINTCEENDIEIIEVNVYLQGFQVKFLGFEGDAILNDASIGHNDYYWETMGFPWDDEDVSFHSPEELGFLLGELKRERKG